MAATEEPTVTEAVRDITESSKQAFEAGQRISEDLEALERRFHEATDWRARIREHPEWIVVGAVAGGLLLWRIFR